MAAEREKEQDKDSSLYGQPIWARFAASMALSLAVVMSVAGVVLYGAARTLSSAVLQSTITETAKLTAPATLQEIEREKLAAERDVLRSFEQRLEVDKSQAAIDFRGRPAETAAVEGYLTAMQEQLKKQRETRERKLAELDLTPQWQPTSDRATHVEGTALTRVGMVYGAERKPGTAYSWNEDGKPVWHVLVPGLENVGERSLLYLIVAMTLAVIVVGAVVSWWVANQVSKPIELLLEDVQVIATGDLDHRTHAKTTGEVGALSRAIDRMTRKLAEARATQVELQVRESELAVAGEVREQLLPQATPKITGYSLGHLHIGSSELGGDFHDFIEIGDGRVGLLVCEVNGKGVPAALVGATARSYLRAELGAGGDVKAALLEVNRQLVRDMRRGVAVTAIFALVDPAQGVATVACAGHKIPLIRFTGADKKVRLVHPEGIALGFDKGPVFERALQTLQVPIEAGDRLVLVNSGAVVLANTQGQELGEKALYGHVMRHGAHDSEKFLERLRAALDAYVDGADLPRDVSVVTIARA